MQTSELTTMTVAEAAAQIERRSLSPVELTRAYLDRIARLNPTINAYVTLTAEQALAAARAAEQQILAGEYRGPLHGVPFALKDIYDTAGVRTAAGSKILAERVPDADATTTALFHQAGAVLLGKLNTHEFAFGVTTNNPHWGATRNPWGLEQIPGGSSGGSGAAIAADLAPIAMGSDTGGSIRIPASLCGTVGLKPTHGRISTAGIFPLSWSLDHAGPLTHTVEDAAIVLKALAGPDVQDTLTPPVPLQDYRADLNVSVRGLRLGVPRAGFCEALEPDVALAFEAALEVLRELGAVVEDVQAPALWASWEPGYNILYSEARHVHKAWLRERPGDYGKDVFTRLNERAELSADDLVAAFRHQSAAMREAAALLAERAALVLPATRIAAPSINPNQTIVLDGKEVLARSVLTTNTIPFNVTGQPAVSLPCGFTAAGLPIGLQIAGRRWDEATVLRVAHAYEQATEWHTRRPSLILTPVPSPSP
ncbi:MAG TPA: amidase [Dehalococcoidia bacterium]|nr:amidase [Dehalococcoidia bacterium]